MWALNGLVYDLVEEKHFRHLFTIVIPPGVCLLRDPNLAKLFSGLNRHTLSRDMQIFAEKMRGVLAKAIAGEGLTVAVDGGTFQRKI